MHNENAHARPPLHNTAAKWTWRVLIVMHIFVAIIFLSFIVIPAIKGLMHMQTERPAACAQYDAAECMALSQEGGL